jgi:hypothetical protein
MPVHHVLAQQSAFKFEFEFVHVLYACNVCMYVPRGFVKAQHQHTTFVLFAEEQKLAIGKLTLTKKMFFVLHEIMT